MRAHTPITTHKSSREPSSARAPRGAHTAHRPQPTQAHRARSQQVYRVERGRWPGARCRAQAPRAAQVIQVERSLGWRTAPRACFPPIALRSLRCWPRRRPSRFGTARYTSASKSTAEAALGLIKHGIAPRGAARRRLLERPAPNWTARGGGSRPAYRLFLSEASLERSEVDDSREDSLSAPIA